MAASDFGLVANLLRHNEALTTANLQLQQEVDSSKRLQFRQETLAKQLETRIKELGASIEAQAVDNSVWATQVEHLLVTVNGQIEDALTGLRARSAQDKEASLPQSTLAPISEQRVLPAVNDGNILSVLLMASRDSAGMNPTHRAIIEEAILDCIPQAWLTPSGNQDQNPVHTESAVHPNTRSSMRPDIAPFIPSHAVTKVESLANVFKGSLDKSIHAVPLTQIPSNWAVNTSLTLNPNADGGVSSYVLKRNIDDWLEASIPPSKTTERTQWRPRVQLSSTGPENVPSKRNRSLETTTDLLDHSRPSQSKPHIRPEGSQVESCSSMMVQDDTSKAESMAPLSSVRKAGQSIHAPSPLVSDEKSTDQPISMQISSLNLPQTTENSPTSKDSLKVELLNPSSPQEHGLSIPVELPKYKAKHDVRPIDVPACDPFSSLHDSQSEVAAASEKQAPPALEHESLISGPSAALIDDTLAPNPSKPSLTQTTTSLRAPSEIIAALTSTKLAPSLSSAPSKALTSKSLAPNPSKSSSKQAFSDLTPTSPGKSAVLTSTSLAPNLSSKPSEALTPKSLVPSLSEPSAAQSLAPNPSETSPTQTFPSLTPTPAEASPVHPYKGTIPSKSQLASTYKSSTQSKPSSALTDKSLIPSESSPARTYKGLDTSKPSHILFEEMMQASKAFSEKTEAQRKAAMDNKPAEDETVEEGLDKLETELPEELRPTYTRVLGSALDARSKELVLKPSKTVGRPGLGSRPVNRPLHLKFERVMVKLLLPSGAIKRLGHLDRPAMANAEICMHMYISETEATSITLVAQIHSTGNDFLVLTTTQARPVLEFNVNFMLPGQLNPDTMTFNSVLLNEQDDFSAMSSITSEIENLREPITQRLKGSLRHMSFVFSHDNFNMLEQEDMPNAEDYQEFTSWDPEALKFFDFMGSFTGHTRKVITMLFADEENSTEDVDDMMTTINRNSRKKQVWRDNGVMWELTPDADGNEKWTVASHKPKPSRHL